MSRDRFGPKEFQSKTLKWCPRKLRDQTDREKEQNNNEVDRKKYDESPKPEVSNPDVKENLM